MLPVCIWWDGGSDTLCTLHAAYHTTTRSGILAQAAYHAPMVPASRCCCGCSLRTGVRWIFAYTLVSSIVQLALDVTIIEEESEKDGGDNGSKSVSLDDEEHAGLESGAIVMFLLILGALSCSLMATCESSSEKRMRHKLAYLGAGGLVIIAAGEVVEHIIMALEILSEGEGDMSLLLFDLIFVGTHTGLLIYFAYISWSLGAQQERGSIAASTPRVYLSESVDSAEPPVATVVEVHRHRHTRRPSLNTRVG